MVEKAGWAPWSTWVWSRTPRKPIILGVPEPLRPEEGALQLPRAGL